MGYTKYTWVDRAVQYASRYLLSLVTGSTYDITAAPGTVTQAGSAQTAARMNNIETGIEAAHKGTHIWGSSTSGNDSYAISFSTAFTAYNTGMQFNFKIDTANTGAATLDVDSLGAKTLKKITSAGKAGLATGDLVANMVYTAIYDGTDFVVANTISAAGIVTTIGDILYASAVNVLSRLGIGTSGKALVSDGTIPGWGYPDPKMYVASDTVRLTANTERSMTGNTYVTLKSFTAKYSGTVRLKFQSYCSTGNDVTAAINGNALGATYHDTQYANKSYDITVVAGGSYDIQLKTAGGTAYLRNCTICADFGFIYTETIID